MNPPKPEQDPPPHYRGYTHAQCEYMPCHQGVEREFNCLFCYCPLIFLQCAGPYRVFVDNNGRRRKNCSDCSLPHDGYERSWRYVQGRLKAMEPWDEQERPAKRSEP